MTDLVSDSLSELTPPSDRDELDAWLIERAEELGALMAEAARLLARELLERFAASLTAAGDLSAFDGAGKVWEQFIAEEVGRWLAEMHISGSLSAWVAIEGGGPDAEELGAWVDVVNAEAALYLEDATNRIVGASAEIWQEVQSRASSAITLGRTNEELKQAIEEITGYAEARADAIARTETIGAYNGGDISAMRALGEAGPVEKVWMATRDARTRRDHARADDQTVGVDEPFVVGGVRMDRPHDPSAPAEQVVNCRCVMAFLFPGDQRPDGSTVGEGRRVDEREQAGDDPFGDPETALPPSP